MHTQTALTFVCQHIFTVLQFQLQGHLFLQHQLEHQFPKGLRPQATGKGHRLFLDPFLHLKQVRSMFIQNQQTAAYRYLFCDRYLL